MKVFKIIEESRIFLTTFLILCPSAADARLADIPADFGTWIILPEDKIVESGLKKCGDISSREHDDKYSSVYEKTR